MSQLGLKVRAADGTITFDSTKEYVLFVAYEEYIPGNSVGTGRSFRFPTYAGKKLVANMFSPVNNGDLDGWAVLSCRVTYDYGVPVVTVFTDNTGAKNSWGETLPVCDGQLVVHYTGASQ